MISLSMGKMLRLKNSKDDLPNWVTSLVRDRIKNAAVARMPKIYYGKHFSDGVAEYREPGKEPLRVLINASTARKMDPTFEGCPLVVLHTDEELAELLPNIMEKADGFVVESFYNQADGCHWTKFLAITEAAHEAISKGWFLSNCYKIKNSTSRGGMWQGLDYQNEVTEGKYEHLAIVPNPRYDSVIYTPEEFKAYNASLMQELDRLANSNDNEGESMFFKKQKVENAKELEATMVELPKSKAQMTVAEAIALADTVKNMQGYCNEDHLVKLNDSEEMSVKDLKAKYNAMVEKSKKDEEAAEGEGAAMDDEFANDESEGDADAEAAEDASLDNMDDKKGDNVDGGEKGGKTQNGLTKAEAEMLAKLQKKQGVADKKQGMSHFNKLSNAADRAALRKLKAEEATSYDSERSQLARGNDRYGSAKK